jgi:DNA sulfur modification protein DndD
MNKLMHKPNFINKVDITILEDIIDIDLISNEGNITKKDSLSKGEQQLFATTLLKTLVEESGIQFPVFIDSPLQKFDKSHANKIITEFYPTISKQVILFPLLHKELTVKELEVMKPLVNTVFVLKNENTHSFIQKVDINDLMKE